jgi:hypothetical protein
MYGIKLYVDGELRVELCEQRDIIFKPSDNPMVNEDRPLCGDVASGDFF